MSESFTSRMLRWKFNLFPAYRGTGARVTYIADDFHEVRIRLPLSLRTRNAVGTIFGGSMYGAVDPIYMIMLMRLLGRGFTVWDKAAEIRFRKPGRTTLHATFKIGEKELAEIRARHHFALDEPLVALFGGGLNARRVRSISCTTTSRSSPSTSTANAAPEPGRRAGWLLSTVSSTSCG